MSTTFSLKHVISVYRLLRQRKITTKLVDLLSITEPKIDGDIHNDRTNLKRFLIRALQIHKGKVNLDPSGDVQLFYRSPLHKPKFDQIQLNDPDQTQRVSVYIRIRIDGELWNLTEYETLELVEGIYKQVNLNLGDDQEIQNYFEDDRYHVVATRVDTIGAVLHKELHEQLTQVREECRRLKVKNSDIMKKLEIYQLKVQATEQEERKLRDKVSRNYLAARNYQTQVKHLTAQLCRPTQKFTIVSSSEERLSNIYEKEAISPTPTLRSRSKSVKTLIKIERRTNDVAIERSYMLTRNGAIATDFDPL